MSKKKIFIACDSSNILKVKKILKETRHTNLKVGYKFGLEFFNSKKGRSFVKKLKKKIIFADLKIHDIPNTCASTVKAIKDLNINYLTIHIRSGLDALKAAKRASGKIKLIGVTVLTSLDNKSLKDIGYNQNLKNIIIKQAKLAKKAKLDGIVCSPKEIGIIKKIFHKEIITPGIRLDRKNNDQKRVLSPIEAFKKGSDWLVIGRPITKGNITKNINNLNKHLK